MTTLEEHIEICNQAEERVALLRANRRPLQDHVRRAREDVARAIKAWQSEFPPKTQADLVREMHLADAARAEANKAIGLPVDYKPGKGKPPSMIDAVAEHSTGGSANQRGGDAFRQGAFHQRYRGRMAPVDAARAGRKPPSQS